MNDWSARDIQAWEYQPLGPFLAKSFATSLSPWVVTMEALAPFRAPAFARADGDPAPLPYLFEPERSGTRRRRFVAGSFSVVGADARSRHRSRGFGPKQFSRYVLDHGADADPSREQWLQSAPWRFAGQRNRSGADKTARGCLLELTSRGQDPVTLPTGEQRKFLEDGDEVILRGFCERDGFRRIGLGSCRGTDSARVMTTAERRAKATAFLKS